MIRTEAYKNLAEQKHTNNDQNISVRPMVRTGSYDMNSDRDRIVLTRIRTESYGTNSDQNRSVRTEIGTVMDKNVIH